MQAINQKNSPKQKIDYELLLLIHGRILVKLFYYLQPSLTMVVSGVVPHRLVSLSYYIWRLIFHVFITIVLFIHYATA